MKVSDKYVKEHEYSQGYNSFSTTDNVSEAIDLFNYKFNADFTLKCMKNHVPDLVLETYELSLVKIE